MDGHDQTASPHGDDSQTAPGTPARTWMAHGTRLFLTTVDGFSPEDFDAPSSLPDWRRREVVAHVHHNAEAMRNLVTWARTGVETPMYASTQARNDDIARSAELPVDELRHLVHASADALEEELDALTSQQRASSLRTHHGGEITAEDIPWIRAREVSLHAIDLGAGLGFDDLDGDFVEALVRDVVEFRIRRGETSVLATWLTGRGASGAELGPWM